jgi:hypothetical protein
VDDPAEDAGGIARGPIMDIQCACRSKQAYLSKAEAKRVARGMSQRHREALHLYRCPHCGYHHVGHIVPAYLRAFAGGAAATGWATS